jgi:hypothetical protein
MMEENWDTYSMKYLGKGHLVKLEAERGITIFLGWEAESIVLGS